MEYYACFSVAVAPLATDAINAFVASLADKTEITASLTTIDFRHLESNWLDQFQFGEGGFRVIHGAHLSSLVASASSAKLFSERSYAATCNFIDQLASEYEWCFFIWGGHSSVRLIAMLARDAKLQSRYLEVLDEISSRQTCKVSPAVIEYKVTSGSRKSFRNALLCKTPDTEAIGRAFDPDNLLIIFVSPAAFEWHTDRAIEQPGWIDEIYINMFPMLPENPLGKWIYQPRDARGIEAVLNLRGREPAILLPASLDLNSIREVSEHLFSAQSNYIIPTAAKAALDSGWIYLSKLGHPDDDYSLFSSSDSDITARFLDSFGESASALVALF